MNTPIHTLFKNPDSAESFILLHTKTQKGSFWAMPKLGMDESVLSSSLSREQKRTQFEFELTQILNEISVHPNIPSLGVQVSYKHDAIDYTIFENTHAPRL